VGDVSFLACWCRPREGRYAIRVPKFVSPKKVVLYLCYVVLFLELASIAGQVSKYVLGFDHLASFVALFDLDGEGNVPTWYSSFTLLLCSILLARISYFDYRNRGRSFLHWSMMSGVFLGMSLDEAAGIHEKMNVLRHILDVGGFFYYAWVIVGIAFVLIFALTYLSFVTQLPARTRRLFFIAGGLFVAGAIGMEMVQGWHDYHHGINGVTSLLTHVEESFEMIGIIVFVYALLSHAPLPVRRIDSTGRSSSDKHDEYWGSRTRGSSQRLRVHRKPVSEKPGCTPPA
jgi:hypothetical protein